MYNEICYECLEGEVLGTLFFFFMGGGWESGVRGQTLRACGCKLCL